MKICSIISTIILTTVITSCGPNKKSPEYRLKQYQIALKNKNFEEAKKYCEKTAVYNLECSLRMGYTDFGITDVKDIKCKVEKETARCKF